MLINALNNVINIIQLTIKGDIPTLIDRIITTSSVGSIDTVIYNCTCFYFSYYIVDFKDNYNNIDIDTSITSQYIDYITNIINIFKNEAQTILLPFVALYKKEDDEILKNIKKIIDSNTSIDNNDTTKDLFNYVYGSPTMIDTMFYYIYIMLNTTDEQGEYYLINTQYNTISDSLKTNIYFNSISTTTNIYKDYTHFYTLIVADTTLIKNALSSSLVKDKIQNNHSNILTMATATLGYINTHLLHYKTTNTLNLSIASYLSKNKKIQDGLNIDIQAIRNHYGLKTIGDITSNTIVATLDTYKVGSFTVEKPPAQPPAPVAATAPVASSAPAAATSPATSVADLFDINKLTYRAILSQFANASNKNTSTSTSIQPNSPYLNITKNLLTLNSEYTDRKVPDTYKTITHNIPIIDNLKNFLIKYLTTITNITAQLLAKHINVSGRGGSSGDGITIVSGQTADINDMSINNLLNSLLNMVASLPHIKLFIFSYIIELFKYFVLKDYIKEDFKIFSNIFKITANEYGTVKDFANITKIVDYITTDTSTTTSTSKSFDELINFTSGTDTVISLLDYFNNSTFQDTLLTNIYSYLWRSTIPFNNSTIINILNENMICDGDNFNILYNKYYDEMFALSQASGQAGGAQTPPPQKPQCNQIHECTKIKQDFENNNKKIYDTQHKSHFTNYSHTKTVCKIKDCEFYTLNSTQIADAQKNALYNSKIHYNPFHNVFYNKHQPTQEQATSLGIILTTPPITPPTPQLTATPTIAIATPTIAIATPPVVKPKPKPKLDYTKIQTYCIEEMRTTYKTNILITNLKALQTGLKTGLQTLPNLLLKGGNIHTKKQTKSNQYKQTKSKQYKQTKNKQYKQYKQYKTKINNINTSGRPDQLTYKKLSTIKNITRKANNKNAFS